jgi:hypothetical protein
VIQGVAALDKVKFIDKVENTSPDGIKHELNYYTIPFQVTKSSDESIARIINLKIGFPIDWNEKVREALPLKEPLVLFIKKDLTDDKAYGLVYFEIAWLTVIKEEDQTFGIKPIFPR